MGNTTSHNIIDNSISEMISSTDSTSQNCAATASSTQSIDATTGEDCSSSSIDISNVSFNITNKVNLVCMATVTQQNSVAAAIDQVASQMATAVSQSVNLNPGSTEADNISKLSTALGVAVSNQINQNIAAAASSSQTITTDGKSKGGGCSQRIHDIDFTAFQTTAAKGVLTATQVASAVANLKQAVDQTAEGKQQSMFLFMEQIAIAAVVGVVLVILVGMSIKWFNAKKKDSAKKDSAKRGHAPNNGMQQPLLQTGPD
jgi:hypothetical protein